MLAASKRILQKALQPARGAPAGRPRYQSRPEKIERWRRTDLGSTRAARPARKAPYGSKDVMTATRKILELNAFDMRKAAGLDPDAADLVARRRRVFGPTSMLFYARPLNLARGEGVWLIGADGTRYLDAYNNVASVGHCQPRVVAAVSKQMATLNTHSRYLCEIVYTYAEKLLATLPRELSNIVLTCTGSESVDLSLRIARAVTDGAGFIVTENAYHGNTLAVTEISPSSASAEPRNPNVFLVPAPDTYRTGSDDVGPLFAANIRKAISAMK